jgi:hypothetical protein
MNNMLYWEHLLENLKINYLSNLILKNAKELTLYVFSALLGGSILYQFLTPEAKPSIKPPRPPKLSDDFDEANIPNKPDSPQGIFKSR